MTAPDLPTGSRTLRLGSHPVSSEPLLPTVGASAASEAVPDTYRARANENPSTLFEEAQPVTDGEETPCSYRHDPSATF